MLDNLATEKARAGEYKEQPTGYRAFIPNPLPPELRFVGDDDCQQLLSKADTALGRLDGVIENLPNPDLFVYMYARKESVLSSKIEGTQSSLHNLLVAEAKPSASTQRSDDEDVKNHVAAMRHGLEALKKLPLSSRLIREIHGRLMAGRHNRQFTPGEFRKSQNWIGGSSLNNASFVPPPPGEVVPAMSDLEKFLHNTTDGLSPLIRIGLAHVQFEAIHPFLDGNGRVGRLLITFFLCEQEILQQPVLYLSSYFMARRAEYYERLQATHEKDDWEGWLRFFLQGVYEVSQDAAKTVRKILTMREEHRGLINENLGRASGNGHRVLELLDKSVAPLITAGEVELKLKVSFATANGILARLEGLGLLRKINEDKRNRVFVYGPYLDLFEAPPEGGGA